MFKKKRALVLWLTITITITIAIGISIFNISPVFGLLAGIIAALLFTDVDKEEVTRLSKKLLQFAVILLGFNLSFSTVFTI